MLELAASVLDASAVDIRWRLIGAELAAALQATLAGFVEVLWPNATADGLLWTAWSEAPRLTSQGSRALPLVLHHANSGDLASPWSPSSGPVAYEVCRVGCGRLGSGSRW